MNVPCIKGHTLKERNFFTRKMETRKKVNIYDHICDSPDLCKDETCEFYDRTEEGTRKYQEALSRAFGSVDGVMYDRKYKDDFHDYFQMKDFKEKTAQEDCMEFLAKQRPDLIQDYLDQFTAQNNLPPIKFDGDFQKIKHLISDLY